MGDFEQLFSNCDLQPQEKDELARLFSSDHQLVKVGVEIVKIIQKEVDLGMIPKAGVILYEAILAEMVTMDGVVATFGEQVAAFVRSLQKVGELYRNHPAVESDAFRKLLLTMAGTAMW